MLILALILSALNAITGTARSLHQMSTDGQFPRFFQHVNRHGVPDRSMIFNVVCSIVVVFFGGAVEIYTFSNVGYLASFIPVLIGYYLLRKHRPNVRRPFRLPEWMKYVALALAAFYAVIYFYGGPVYATARATRPGHKTLPYYFIGIVRAAAYLPLYWWRKRGRGQAETPMRRPARRSRRRPGAAPRSVSAIAVRRIAMSRCRPGSFERILLASEGRADPDAAIARVDRARRPAGASVHVFSVARVHGVAFGLPNPGLLPTKAEWAEQREIVAKAVKRLKRKGIEADGHVLGTRKPTKRICEEAEQRGLRRDRDGRRPGSQPRRSATFMWSQEPQRVRRKAKLPVFLVPRRADEAARPARPVGYGALRAAVQPRELDRQLEREQVVLVEVEPGQLLDPAQPLAQRVGVDEQRAGALDHAAALGQIALERVEQRRAPPAVVVDQQVDGGPHPVARRVVGADLDQVAVGAELRVGDRAAVAQQRAADRRGVARLAVGAGGIARARSRSSLTPIAAPVRCAELAAGAQHAPRRAAARRVRRAPAAARTGPGPASIAERGSELGERRGRAPRRRRATRPRPARRAPAGSAQTHQVRGGQVAADLGRLGGGERGRPGGQRLEQVLDRCWPWSAPRSARRA